MLNAIRPICVAAVCLAAVTATGGEPTTLSVLTGRGSSVYYTLGVALASSIEKAVPGVKTLVQGTKGPIENLDLLRRGSAEIAFAPGDVLAEAWKGTEESGFKAPLKSLRGIAAIYPDYVQIVARADSGIRALSDLKGKRVSVGAPRSVTELDARMIFTAAGLPYSSFAATQYFPFGESVELMKDGRIDAMVQSGAAGALALRDLANALDIVVVPVPPDVIEKIHSAVYLPATIPANTYRGQTMSVPVAAVQNYLVTRADLDADVVYAITKALWTGVDQLVAAHPAAKAMDRRRALEGMPVPLHPGAEKYYKEIRLIR